MTTTRGVLVATLCLSMCVFGGAASAQIPGMPSIPGGGGLPSGIPGADCGKVSSTKAGIKLEAFLAATGELDKASASLEASVKAACVKMGKELGVPTEGSTKVVCANVAAALKKGLKASVKASAKVKTKITPAQCTVKADFAAEVAAKCEGKAKADIKATCEGTCRGTCNGACKGTCATKNAQGQCAGECSGTCGGSCSGTCEGSAKVDASAECKASAQARANMKAECTEPKVEVDVDSALVVDAAGFERAKKAISVGLPALLMAGAKAKLVQKSATLWAQSASKLARSGLSLGGDMGKAAMCMGGQLAAAAKVAGSVNARVSVSIQASASVSGAAGGSVK